MKFSCSIGNIYYVRWRITSSVPVVAQWHDIVEKLYRFKGTVFFIKFNLRHKCSSPASICLISVLSILWWLYTGYPPFRKKLSLHHCYIYIFWYHITFVGRMVSFPDHMRVVLPIANTETTLFRCSRNCKMCIYRV